MIIRLLAGGALLVLGRKLFWLFVAAVGFAAGWAVATDLLSVQPEWLALVIAVAVGVVGVLVAQFVQRLAHRAGGLPGRCVPGAEPGEAAQPGSCVVGMAGALGGRDRGRDPARGRCSTGH